MSQFVQAMIDAVSVGALFALEALAVGLLFVIIRLANFALGTVITASSYALYEGRQAGLVGAMAGAVAVAVVLCVLMERFVFRPLRSKSDATLFVASLALAFLLENTLLLIFGPDQRSFHLDALPSGAFTVGGYYITKLSVLTIAMALILLTGVAIILRGSAIGIRMRAAADDFGMARLVGVRANAVIGTAFAIAGVLSAAVALVLTSQRGGVTPALGDNAIIFALLGAVVGGLDRLVGAAVGGFVVGAVFSLLSTWLPVDLINFNVSFLVAVVVLLLLVRPAGLVRSGTLKERV